MIKVIQSQDSSLNKNDVGYIRNMSQYKAARTIWRIVFLLSIILIPVLIIWFIYEKVTKKTYLSGQYLILGKNKYSLDNPTIKLEELTSENGNTVLGAVAGGVLFGGIGALGGAVLGSRKSGVFVMTDENNKKTLLEVKGTGTVKQFRELIFIEQAYA